MTRAGAFGVVLLAAMLWPTGAAAEMLGNCDWVAVPTDSESVPANLPAFLLLDRKLNRDDGPRDAIWIRSFHEAGDAIGLPFTERIDRFSGGTMAVFGAPLEEGRSYEIVAPHSCSDEPANVIEITHGIRVVAPVPLPRQLGTLQASRPKDQNDPIRLALDLAPEMAPWIHAALIDVTVEGALFARRPFVELTNGQVVVVTPRTFCPSRENALLDLKIELLAHLAGTPEDPLAALVVAPVHCKADVVVSPPSAGPSAVVVQPSACGCRAVRAIHPTGAGIFLVGLSLLALRRRSTERPRRRRRLS